MGVFVYVTDVLTKSVLDSRQEVLISTVQYDVTPTVYYYTPHRMHNDRQKFIHLSKNSRYSDNRFVPRIAQNQTSRSIHSIDESRSTYIIWLYE